MVSRNSCAPKGLHAFARRDCGNAGGEEEAPKCD